MPLSATDSSILAADHPDYVQPTPEQYISSVMTQFEEASSSLQASGFEPPGIRVGVSGRRFVGPPQNTYILCTNQKNPAGCSPFRRVQSRFECYNFVGVLSSTYWIDLNTETPRFATSNFGRLVLRPPYIQRACVPARGVPSFFVSNSAEDLLP